MTTVTNTCEGGTDGATVTNANSGGASGTAFSTNAIVSTPTFKTAGALLGSVSVGLGTAGSSGIGVGWANSVLGTMTDIWVRFYINLPSLPTGATGRIMLAKDADAGSVSWILGIGTDGKFRIGNSSGAIGANETAAVISAGTTYRLEARLTHGTGNYELRVYALGSSTPLATKTGTLTGIGADTEWICFGRGAGGSGTFTAMIDGLGVSDSDWLGDAGDVPRIAYVKRVVIGG